MIEKSNIIIRVLIIVLNVSIVIGTLSSGFVLIEDSLLEMCDFGEKDMEDKEENQEEERKVHSEFLSSIGLHNYINIISCSDLSFVLRSVHYLEYPTPPPKFRIA